ncbi:MAG TPA: DUF4157 domain-containing protein [Candidatus Angelobacter sp.]|jgi:hypothetical protein|nr:DUF4157 domain-containing protein [Candidatus Angelobacter sp.]
MREPKQIQRKAEARRPAQASQRGVLPQRFEVTLKSAGQPVLKNLKREEPSTPAQIRSHTAPGVLQAKMHVAPPREQSRAIGCAAGGVVQANVIGGNHALQARLNLWNTRLSCAAGPKVDRNHQGPAQNSRAIQRKTGPGVEAFRVPLRQKSGGLPLPNDVRAKMETAFGTDFSDVRVHIGREASSLGAIAYTWGSNIHFAPGQYNPHTLQGQKLLGHELWHVVQQKSGRVKNPFGGGVAVVQDHALEAEADRMGIKAALTQVVRRREE